MLRRDLYLIAIIILTWGFHAPIMKLGVTLVPPVSLNVVRFFGTFLLFLPFATLPKTKSDWIILIKIALFFNCGNLMFAYMALDTITSNSFIFIIMTAIPFSILIERIFLKTKFGLYTSIGILVCFIGLAIAFGAPDLSSSPIGTIFAILAALFWSIGSFFMKKASHINLPTFLSMTCLIATPIALVTSYFRESGQIEAFLAPEAPIQLIFVILYQVGLMSVMMFTWKGLIARNPAQFVMPFLMLQPLVGVAGASLLLDEELSARTLYGGLFIMSGLSLIHWRKLLHFKKKSKPHNK